MAQLTSDPQFFKTEALIHHLPDGRGLGYVCFGDPEGKPVLYFHGMPASRLEACLIAASCDRQQIRLIAVDRPGMGASDFQPKRRVTDWPVDVAHLVDALGLDQFFVLGVSGGGAYAAACARYLPERINRAAIVSGMVPIGIPGVVQDMGQTNRLSWRVARYARWLYGILVGQMADKMRRDPDVTFQQMLNLFGEVDRQVLTDPKIQQICIATFLDAFRQGNQGVAWEMNLQTRPWGFSLAEITVPIQLWQGEQDTTVPPAMARYQAGQIPNCVAQFLPNAGHASLIANHQADILAALTAD